MFRFLAYSSRAPRWLLGGAVLAIVTFGRPTPLAEAFPMFDYVDLPNYATDPASTMSPFRCITCHNNPNGGMGCVGAADPSNIYPDVFRCFNPFGMAFNANSKNWNPTLATQD